MRVLFHGNNISKETVRLYLYIIKNKYFYIGVFSF